MSTININCICYKKSKDKSKLCLLAKISGVEVTPSVTSVESSEQFWHKIRQIWCICEPWALLLIPEGGYSCMRCSYLSLGMIKIFSNSKKQLAQALKGFFIITLQQFNDTIMHDAFCQHLQTTQLFQQGSK